MHCHEGDQTRRRRGRAPHYLRCAQRTQAGRRLLACTHSLDDEPKANLPDAAGGLRAAAGVNGSITTILI